MTLKDESPSLEGVQYATWEEWRTTTNSSSKNYMAGPKQEFLFGHSAVDAFGGESKV